MSLDLSDLRRRPSVSRLDGSLDSSPDRRLNRCSRSGSVSVVAGGGAELALLELLLARERDPHQLQVQHPHHAFPRRHSAHCYPTDDDAHLPMVGGGQQAPPLPLRPPAVPERSGKQAAAGAGVAGAAGAATPTTTAAAAAAAAAAALRYGFHGLQQQAPPPLPPPFAGKHPKLPPVLAGVGSPAHAAQTLGRKGSPPVSPLSKHFSQALAQHAASKQQQQDKAAGHHKPPAQEHDQLEQYRQLRQQQQAELLKLQKYSQQDYHLYQQARHQAYQQGQYQQPRQHPDALHQNGYKQQQQVQQYPPKQNNIDAYYQHKAQQQQTAKQDHMGTYRQTRQEQEKQQSQFNQELSQQQHLEQQLQMERQQQQEHKLVDLPSQQMDQQSLHQSRLQQQHRLQQPPERPEFPQQPHQLQCQELQQRYQLFKQQQQKQKAQQQYQQAQKLQQQQQQESPQRNHPNAQHLTGRQNAQQESQQQQLYKQEQQRQAQQKAQLQAQIQQQQQQQQQQKQQQQQNHAQYMKQHSQSQITQQQQQSQNQVPQQQQRPQSKPSQQAAQNSSQYAQEQQQQQQHKPQQQPQAAQQQTPTTPAAGTSTSSSTPNGGKVSVRQDSNVSSDSFSQNSSPSYTTKSMETPLLPRAYQAHASAAGAPRGFGASKGGGGGGGAGAGEAAAAAADASGAAAGPAIANGNAPLTKSISTPASLQTIVRFHHGSNMSLHHRIIRDMRRPSAHYITQGRLRFRFAQVLVNAIALLAIAGGLAAYFKAYPSTVRYVNKTVAATTVALTKPTQDNPMPGICLPVIVTFCHYHKIPYNYTMFPNYMGHFTQRDAQTELEVYDVVVDVRCYELAALFLCSVFVPKCGPNGDLVRPCRGLCKETKRRCGFFLEVFGLALPEYLECELFPEDADTNVCVGHREVAEAKLRAQKPVCTAGFQCDVKRCIPKDWRCDGHIDCQDRTDELHCETCSKQGLIHCGEKRCMSQSHVCDGIVDCPWGQDERNCLRLSERMGDEGSGVLEVFQPEEQAWRPACISHWGSDASARDLCAMLGYTVANYSELTMLSGSSSVRTVSSNSSSSSNAAYYGDTMWRTTKQRNVLKEMRSCTGKDYATVKLTCSNFACGQRRHPNYPRPSTRIVGGFESTPGDWPFLAALLGGPEEVFYCAGVLIADQWVLTASHCVGNFSHSEPSGWTIQLGITRRHSHSFYGQKMKVRRVVPHPMYNMGVAHDNDVALFQLKTRVRFHEHLLPVCLPPANHELHPGTLCTVIGWGKKEDKDASEYEPAVNEVVVPVLNRNLCNMWLVHKDLNVTEGMICAGYAEGGKDACQGDSGGPLLCQDEKNPDRWFVGGIVSWGIKCAHPHLPGVYAYVPRYVPWIKQQMALYSD